MSPLSRVDPARGVENAKGVAYNFTQEDPYYHKLSESGYIRRFQKY